MVNEKAFYQVNEYLSLWKRDLDDASLDRTLLKMASSEGPFRTVLDLGTGSGTQVRRNIDEKLVADKGTVIGIDVNREGLVASISDYRDWAEGKGYRLETEKNHTSSVLELTVETRENRIYNIRLYCGSVYDLRSCLGNEIPVNGFEFVTALSLFEHTNIERALNSTRDVMRNNSYLYAPSNYNGTTRVTPVPSTLREGRDSLLMDLFNEIMINKQNIGGVDSGESYCGDLLPVIAKRNGFETEAVGDSSWVIDRKSNDNQRKAYIMFLDAIHSGLLSPHDTPKEKIKERVGITDKEIETWYRSAIKNFYDRTGTYFCSNKDVLLRRID